MRKLFPLACGLLSGLVTMGQDDPGTQIITPVTYGSCGAVSGTLIGSTASGIASCAGIADEDNFYTFTATTPGVKVTGTTATFNMVIQILDVGLTSVACEDANGGNGGETLWTSALIIGQTYHIRIYSFTGSTGAFTVCTEKLPVVELRPGWYDFGPSGDGYVLPEPIKRTFFVSPVVEATRWKLVNQANGEECIYTLNGIATQVNLNVFGCLCYGNTYDVWVEVRVAGQWCGYSVVRQIIMEAAPSTFMLPAYANQTYDIYQDVLGAAFVSNGQRFEWEFSTDNGATVFTVLGNVGSSQVLLYNIPEMRYNKIYQIRIRVQICGLWGPWSTTQIIFIGPIPYTQLQPEYCDVTIFPNQVILCNYVENATQYAWQIAPIECDDPEFIPLGPAQVFITNNTALNLQLAELDPGTCYRVAAKPFVGEQQGDYGYFCQVLTAGNPPIAPGGQENDIIDPEVRSEVAFIPDGLTLFPNPAGSDGVDLMYQTSVSSTGISIRIMSLAGAVIYESLEANTGNFVYHLPTANMSPGIYLIQVNDGVKSLTERLLIN